MVEEKGSQPCALGGDHKPPKFPVPPTQLCPAGDNEPKPIEGKVLELHGQGAAPEIGEFLGIPPHLCQTHTKGAALLHSERPLAHSTQPGSPGPQQGLPAVPSQPSVCHTGTNLEFQQDKGGFPNSQKNLWLQSRDALPSTSRQRRDGPCQAIELFVASD